MVVFDERTVAQFPRGRVVPFNAFWDIGTGHSRVGFVAISAQPLAVVCEFVTGVDTWQWGWNPAGFQGVGGVCTGTGRFQAELGAGFKNGFANAIVVFIWSPQF